MGKVRNGLGQLNFSETEQCVQRSVCFTGSPYKHLFLCLVDLFESSGNKWLVQITHFLGDGNSAWQLYIYKSRHMQMHLQVVLFSLNLR